MKKISSSIAATIAGLALSFGGASVALAGGEQDPFAQQEKQEDESLIEGVEQQELSGTYDQDTTDDWFYDTYEIGEQEQAFAEEPELEEPELEEPRFELDRELIEQQRQLEQELQQELQEQAFGQEQEQEDKDLFEF